MMTYYRRDPISLSHIQPKLIQPPQLQPVTKGLNWEAALLYWLWGPYHGHWQGLGLFGLTLLINYVTLAVFAPVHPLLALGITGATLLATLVTRLYYLLKGNAIQAARSAQRGTQLKKESRLLWLIAGVLYTLLKAGGFLSLLFYYLLLIGSMAPHYSGGNLYEELAILIAICSVISLIASIVIPI